MKSNYFCRFLAFLLVFVMAVEFVPAYAVEELKTFIVSDTEKIVELAVPQPEGECMADSGLCVLSVGTDGQFKWVNVTEPAQ